jgi:hypothetical protein
VHRGDVADPFAALNPLPSFGKRVLDDGESRALLSVEDVVEEPVFQAIHFVLLFHRGASSALESRSEKVGTDVPSENRHSQAE